MCFIGFRISPSMARSVYWCNTYVAITPHLLCGMVGFPLIQDLRIQL